MHSPTRQDFFKLETKVKKKKKRVKQTKDSCWYSGKIDSTKAESGQKAVFRDRICSVSSDAHVRIRVVQMLRTLLMQTALHVAI